MVDRPSRTRLLFVRHGESVVTVRQVVGGELTCEGLSELGRRQAEALRDRWNNGGEAPIDAIWSSTLPRAVETAAVVAEGLDMAVQTHPDLVEQRPGEADGVPFADFPARFGPPDWESRPHVPMAPGGESMATFHHRASQAIEEVAVAHRRQTVMVVCHGGVIDIAFRYLLDLPRYGHFDLWTLNCSVTELSVDDTGERRGRWRLVRYNDAAHLEGLPRGTPRRQR